MLILIRGISGSGKSTLSKTVIYEHSLPDSCHLEADMFFETRKGYKFDAALLHKAHSWCLLNTEKLLRVGSIPVVSNTFTTVKEMRPYFDLAIEYDVNVQLLEPDTDWKFDAEKLFSYNQHGVPMATIEKQLDRWQPLPTGIYTPNDLKDINASN